MKTDERREHDNRRRERERDSRRNDRHSPDRRRRRSRNSRSRSRSPPRHQHQRNDRYFNDKDRRDRYSAEKDIKVKIKREPESDIDDQRQSRRDNDRRREEASTSRNKEFKKFTSKNDEKFTWGKEEKKEEKPIEKEKPNFEVSGKLAADTNTYNGVVIKYNEPPEARKPKLRWRLYPFKGDEALEFVPIHRQSAYLLGRDRRIADIPIDHPSCSKQHAVLQYRLIRVAISDLKTVKRVRPYVIDLGSANGTFVNNQRIEAQRYYEVFEKDVIKFGFSSREYVILHENSKDDETSGDEEEQEPESEKEEGDEQKVEKSMKAIKTEPT